MNNHEQERQRHNRQEICGEVPLLNMDSVKVISPVGRGAKGVVFMVEEKKSGELWALKVILRELVEKNNEETKDGSKCRRICFEQEVLSGFKHPLLPRLLGVLSTQKIVAYAIDYCPGRDLNHLRKQQSEKMFSADIIRFYAAELVLALEYLHNSGIAYRDLKPENIMIQENGHIMLVDFDLSTKLSTKSLQINSQDSNSVAKSRNSILRKSKKRFFPVHRFCKSGVSPDDSSELSCHQSAPPATDSCGKSNSFVGTEEYVAPEVIQGYGHDFAVDCWSLGVVLYEMLYGATPFKGANRKETFFRILTKSPELVGEATPLRDLIGKLLVKDPMQRIKLEGIKGHDFFKGVNWDFLVQILRPPYIPFPGNPLEENVNKEGQGTEGMKNIDMEMFMQGIFAGRGGEVEKNKKVDGEENLDDDEYKKTKDGHAVWVKGLNNHPCETENFFVF